MLQHLGDGLQFWTKEVLAGEHDGTFCFSRESSWTLQRHVLDVS